MATPSPVPQPAAQIASNQGFAYDVFLSHNAAQKDWTRSLARRLRDDGFRVFFDEWDMPKYAGMTWSDVLARCVEQTPKVVLVWSPEFFNNEWPTFESSILQTLDPVGSKGRILPVIHTEAALPKRWAFLQALPFDGAQDGSIEFAFRYQQLLFNLDNTRPFEGDFLRFKTQYLIEQNQSQVWSADKPPLSAEDENHQLRELRAVIYQAPRYSTPTYFLDPHLAVVHWNVAFELIFKPILPKIRRRHVNFFIVELANRDDVFDHARDFTERLKGGRLPLVDLEPVVYQSPVYGTMEFIKVATQLTDTDAGLQAWSVALLPKRIDWSLYQDDLEERLREDRLWGLYAVSYDKILCEFKPYQELISAVIAGIPPRAQRVLELGAGTGNVTRQLLLKGCAVTAVENNTFMLEKMAGKNLHSLGRLSLLVESVENTEFDNQRNFDAAVAVNVVYALDDPLRCFRNVAEALKKGSIFAFSTTHSQTDLEALLAAIKDDLVARGCFGDYQEHYERLVGVNREIQQTIARRYSLKDYSEWLGEAGFKIVLSEPKYYDAVQVIHARKI